MALVEYVLAGTGTPFGDMASPGNAFNGVTSEAGAACATATRGTDTSPVDCYVGTTLATPKRFGQAIVHGSNAQGFVTVTNPSVSLWVYGRSGSNPANATDGTLLAGPLTFTDTANESAGRTLSISSTSTFDRVWVRLSQAGTSRLTFIAELRIFEVVASADLVAAEAAVADTSSFTGAAVAAGALVATEAAVADTAALSATGLAAAALAATDSGVDVAALSAAATAAAALVAAEAVAQDTAVFTAVLIPFGSATAALAATEAAVADTAAFAAVLVPFPTLVAALVVTEAAVSDTAAFAAVLVPLPLAASASLAATEALPPDTAVFLASVPPVVVVPPRPPVPAVSPSGPAPVWPSTGVAPSVRVAPSAPQVRTSSAAPAVATPRSSPAVPVPPVWSSPCCAPYFPPSAVNPLPWPPPPQTDTGGFYSPAFTLGLDVATPPFPPDSKSRIAAMPPLPAPPLEGYCRAGDPRAPQRTDSEEYRRAVFLGLITPWNEPAVQGVAIAAPEKRSEADRENAAVTHSDDATQIHPDSYDYDHGFPGQGSFSQEFG